MVPSSARDHTVTRESHEVKHTKEKMTKQRKQLTLTSYDYHEVLVPEIHKAQFGEISNKCLVLNKKCVI